MYVQLAVLPKHTWQASGSSSSWQTGKLFAGIALEDSTERKA
jgi:hypothetical protein